MTSIINDTIIEELENHFIHRNDKLNRWGNAIPSIQMLTGLRGVWPMSSSNPAGQPFDFSEQGRTLTYNGNPTYNYDGLIPYISLDGTGDFLSRADEAGLSITGTETVIASAVRGLTFSGWFRTADVTPAADSALISKWLVAGNQQSYEIILQTTGALRGAISVDGTASTTVDSTQTISDDTWFNVVLRLTPSAELAIFVNGVSDLNVAAIPASIFDSTADFVIGGLSGGLSLFTGDASLSWICAAMLSEELILGGYEQEKKLFGL